MSESVSSGSTAELAIPARDDLSTILDEVTEAFAVPRPAGAGLDSTHGVADAVLARAPGYSFGGAGITRGKGGTSKFRAMVPAPGTYDQHNQVGEAQATSNLGTAPRTVFGSSDRFSEQEKLYAGGNSGNLGGDSPGPGAYPAPRTMDGDRPTYSFPKSLRDTQKPVNPRIADIPGPGSYYAEASNAHASVQPGTRATTSSLGRQVASTKRSSPIPRMGNSQRNAFHKQFHGSGLTTASGGLNPGFKYNSQRSGLGKQAMSSQRTKPAFSFGAASPRKLPRNFHAVQEERRAAAKQRLLEVTKKWELDVGPGKRKSTNPHDYSWLYETTVRPSTGDSKGVYKTRSDGCELRRGQSYRRSPQFSFSSSSRFSERQYMPHRPDTLTKTIGPGPKYNLPSRVGEVPGHSFSKSARQATPNQRNLAPGPGSYNIRADARIEEFNVVSLLQEMQATSTSDPLTSDMASPVMTSGSEAAEPRDTQTPTPPQKPKRSPLRDSFSPLSRRRVYSPVRVPGMPLLMTEGETLRRPRSSTSFSNTMHTARTSSPLAHTISYSPTRFGAVSSKPRSPRPVFGRAERGVAPKIFAGSQELNAARLGVDSPGPSYQTRPGGSSGPKYTFGGEGLSVATSTTRKSEGGDALVNVGSSLLRQVVSKNRSPPVAHFGSDTRNSTAKLYMPGVVREGEHSPGPVYSRMDSVGTQVLAQSRTSPRPIIGTARRLLNEVPRESLHVPGPGTYGKHNLFQKLPSRKKAQRRAERARRKAAAKK